MSRQIGRLSGVLGGVAALLIVIVLASSSCTQAQKAPPKPAAAAATAPPEAYVGAETCKGCHEEQYVKFSKTKMGQLFLKHPRSTRESLACEGCHGPGKAHADAGGGKGVGGMISFRKNDPTPIEQRNAQCLQCHERSARLFWQGSAHEARDVACTNCHTVMEDVSPRFQLARATQIETCGQCHIQKRAQQMRFTHMPLLPGRYGDGSDGKMTCTSCHNPHGTVTQALLKENSANETCYTCHAEKRSPFLWEHPPVTESCTNCHDPHGSNHENMLKLAKPRLCQQCHVETRHPTNPYGTDLPSLKFVVARQCANCHASIHGSNHPAGRFFAR